MPPIVITGDIHQASLRSRHSAVLAPQRTELSITYRFLDLCNSHGFVPTVFAPGRMVEEEEKELRRILDCYRFELGGHTYDCYQTGKAVYRIARLLKSSNGPRSLQAADIRDTLSALRSLGKPVISWRNHAYRNDHNTMPLLARADIRVVSNRVEAGGVPARVATPHGDLWDIPINVLPDHENLRHGGGRLSISAWRESVLRQIEENERQSRPSVLLIHPACMEIEDGMATLKSMLDTLAGCVSCTIGDVPTKSLTRSVPCSLAERIK